MHRLRQMILIVAALCVIGCGSGSQSIDEDYMKSAEEVGKARREIFVRYEGDYGRLSPEDKAAYLKTFNGDEKNAQQFWEFMKNPPSSSAPIGLQQRQ